MKKSQAVCLFSLLTCLTFSHLRSFAGGIASGGGHSIYCLADSKLGFPKDGFYSVDYVLHVENNQMNEVYTNYDLYSHLARIQAGLAAAPELASRFSLFIANINNRSVWSKKNRYVWKDYPAGLIPTRDFDTEKVFPEVCKRNGIAQLFQVTVRRAMNQDVAHFEITQRRLDELAETSALQLSYHYVHEFLRDYTNEAKTLGLVNHFFHSVGFENINEATLINNLKNMGLGVFKGQSEIESKQKEERDFFYPLAKGANKKFHSLIDQFVQTPMDESFLPRASSREIQYNCTQEFADGHAEQSLETLTAHSDTSYSLGSMSRLASLKFNSSQNILVNDSCIDSLCQQDRFRQALPFSKRRTILFMRFNEEIMQLIVQSQSAIDHMPSQNYNRIDSIFTCRPK